jgi:hypothetical protein
MPSLASEPSKDKKHYPSFHIEGKESLDLPESGEMTIAFKRTNETRSVNEDGEKRYSCTIEVTKILDMEEEADEAPAHGSDKSVSDILDGLMKAHEKAGNSSDEKGY